MIRCVSDFDSEGAVRGVRVTITTTGLQEVPVKETRV